MKKNILANFIYIMFSLFLIFNSTAIFSAKLSNTAEVDENDIISKGAEKVNIMKQDMKKKVSELLPTTDPKHALYMQLGITQSLIKADTDINTDLSFNTESVKGFHIQSGYERFFITLYSFHISGLAGIGYVQKGYGVMAYQGVQSLIMHYGQLITALNFSYNQFVNMEFGFYTGYLISVSQRNTKYSNDTLYQKFNKNDTGYLFNLGIGFPIGNSYIVGQYTYQKSFNTIYETLNARYKNDSSLFSIGFKKIYY